MALADVCRLHSHLAQSKPFADLQGLISFSATTRSRQSCPLGAGGDFHYNIFVGFTVLGILAVI